MMRSRTDERDRSRSPRQDENRRHRRRRSPDGRQKTVLPFRADELTKHDLRAYRPMFALYLDIQKQIDIEDLPEEEVKGRWKSFFKKWNCGQLAEGWYDPSTLHKAQRDTRDLDDRKEPNNPRLRNAAEDDGSDSEFGPTVPMSEEIFTDSKTSATGRSGPSIPSLQDIQSRDEDDRIAAQEARRQHSEEMRHSRKREQKTQKDRLDEIAPRSEAGTRERQLEKRREAAASNRDFAAAKDAGGDVEVRESDLMGEDTLADLKRMQKEREQKKTEREIKREEILRARAAEREERSKRLRDREEKTMEMLRELARSRFGDGNERPPTLGEDR